MSRSLQVCVVAIGTELTSGEVVNSNASWLSEQLEELGFSVVSHITVADERKQMSWALEQAKQQAALIFLTGGLGPTTDDFTREVVAQWSGRPLVFDEESFAQITATLRSRKLAPKPGHKEECRFPRGAQLLANPVGTAKGFILSLDGLELFVLPGPPREIQGIWKDHLQAHLLRKGIRKERELQTWVTFGRAESEVAEIVERELQGAGLTIGYRATPPFVRVKLWLKPEENSWAQKLDKALASCLAGKNDFDGAREFLKKLGPRSVSIRDGVSLGRLAGRLEAAIASHDRENRPWPAISIASGEGAEKMSPVENSQITLALRALGTDQVVFSLESPKVRNQTQMALPYGLTLQSQRGRSYAIEAALQWWLKLDF